VEPCFAIPLAPTGVVQNGSAQSGASREAGGADVAKEAPNGLMLLSLCCPSRTVYGLNQPKTHQITSRDKHVHGPIGGARAHVVYCGPHGCDE
jgi:hypothetical protein